MSATRRSSKGKPKNGNGSGGDLSPEDVAGLLEIAKKIPQLADDEKRALLRTLTPQRKRSSEIELEQRARAVDNSVRAPQNDDELWQFIKDRTGFEIPRVAVCDDHQAPFDFLADAYFNRKRAILVMASREAGKCLPGDTLIYDPVRGDRVRLDEVVGGKLERILTMTDDGSVVEAPITFRFATGRKECFRVRTLAGREVEVTGEHPFRTAMGWTRCDELEDGEFIATPARIPRPSKPESIPDEHLDLLAVLLAEGTYSQVSVGFSTDSYLIWKIVSDASGHLGCYVRKKKSKKKNSYDYGISYRPSLKNPVREMLDLYGIGHELAPNKSFPDVIFNLPDEQLQRFLSIFWMCDGYIEKMCPGVTLASKKMIEQIQHLLLRFGVQSKVAYKISKFEGKEFDSWRLSVYGNCIPAFSDVVNGLWGEKKKRLDDCVARDRCPSSGRPAMTDEMMLMMRNRFPQRRRGLVPRDRAREALEMLGWRSESYDNGKMPGAGVSMLYRGRVLNLQARRLRALCHAYNVSEDEFSLLLNKDLWWDPVVEIESVGEKDVYDLTMLPTSSFVANDVIVHNTLGVSILHVVNAETKPGIESVTFGAVLSQAKRAYRHVKSFIYTKDSSGNKIPRPEIEGDPTRMETNYKSGSLIELITGSKSGVNSPHPQVVHADEIDLIIDLDVWTESRNMSSSGIGEDGNRIPALDIATSTRKSTKGLMQQLIDEVAEAKRNGHKPAWEIYTFCVAEVAEEVPTCRCADPIERVHRLVKLGRDPRETCECDRIVKSEWREGVPRTLESVCRGRFFRSRGWMPFEDVVGKFMQNSQIVWEAQMECRRPMADGIYLPTFSRQRHCVRGWVPRPEYGRLFVGVDWGGAAPSVCIWFQGPIPHPIEILGFDHQPVVVPQGSYIAFDQIECPSMGAAKFGDEVVEKENNWREQFPGWRIRGRFTDMAGRQQREDWHEHNPPLRTHWYISRDFDPTVETLQDLVGDGRLFLDITRCDSLCGDFESWRQKNGKEVQDASTHGPAAARYGLANAVVLERKEKKRGESSKVLPIVKERGLEDPSGAIPALQSRSGSTGGRIETESWRRSMGMLGSSPERGVQGWRIG